MFALGTWLLPAANGRAGQGPLAAMFADDRKREETLASSFLSVEVPATGAAPSLHVYLSAGDLERAFDGPTFRPDAAIVPTNTDLDFAAPWPATQRVLIDRVRQRTEAMRRLEEQAAARRRQRAGGGSAGGLQIGVDTFVAELDRAATPQNRAAAFPAMVCMVPTDFPQGGAIDRRDLFTQDRVRGGIAACLTALDASGARSVVMPLMGAASSGTQANDPVYEGQRLLKECRLLNAVAGLALGIHDYAPGRRSVREIGIVQWDRELTDMFGLPGGSRPAQMAYRTYAEQANGALQRGLAGRTTTPGDVAGNCAATFNAR